MKLIDSRVSCASIASLTWGIGHRRSIHQNLTLTEHTVLVPMHGHLITQAIRMEHVTAILTALKPHNYVSFPDALKADRTVEALALLEKQGAIWQLTDR